MKARPGWYPDQEHPNYDRYWDGERYTERRERPPAGPNVLLGVSRFFAGIGAILGIIGLGLLLYLGYIFYRDVGHHSSASATTTTSTTLGVGKLVLDFQGDGPTVATPHFTLSGNYEICAVVPSDDQFAVELRKYPNDPDDFGEMPIVESRKGAYRETGRNTRGEFYIVVHTGASDLWRVVVADGGRVPTGACVR